MAAARRQRGFFARGCYRFLFARNRRRRLERDAKENVFAVADSALHSAGEICRRSNFPSAHLKWIVVFGTVHLRRGKARTDFKTFCRRQAQHRFRQIGFEFIEDRLAQTARRIAR